MTNQNKILRLPEVIETVGLSKSTIYSFMRDGMFPKSVNLGSNSRGWLLNEVNSWLEHRIAERDEVAA